MELKYLLFGLMLGLVLIPGVLATPTDFLTWTYKQNVTLLTDQLGIKQDITNDHAILVNISPVLTSFWAGVRVDGQDIRFADSTDSVPLAYHIDKWDYVNEEALIWVKITDTFPAATNLTFYMYYGNVGAGGNQTIEGTYPSDYLAVYHFNETSGNITDLTSYNHDSETVANYINYSSPGAVGVGMNLDGVNKQAGSGFFNITNYKDFQVQDITLIAWVNVSAWGPGHCTLWDQISGNDRGIAFMTPNDATGRALLRIGDGGTPTDINSSSSIQTDKWEQIIFAFSDTTNNASIYFNGTLDIASETARSPTYTDLWNIQLSSDYFTWPGALDEIKILNRSISQDEAALLYRSDAGNLTYFGETQAGENVLTIHIPQNTTYYYSNISLNVTATVAITEWKYNLDNGGNITFTPNITIFVPDGTHIIEAWGAYANGLLGDQVTFTVVNGLNISVFGNETGALTDWTLYATNGSFSATFYNQNNPAIFDISDLPYGHTNITVSDSQAGLYYNNYSINWPLNSTTMSQFNFNLTKKGPQALTLTASPSASVALSVPVTVTCTAQEGAPILRRGTTAVSNPNTFVGPSGSYLYNCTIGETPNYAPSENALNITIGGLSPACTSTNLYAFRYNYTINYSVTPETNITTFDFGALVAVNFTKPDLSDVKADNLTLYKNLTGGYYIIADLTNLSTAIFEFGNYKTNNNYDSVNRSVDIVSIDSYLEINDYYLFTIYDETTQVEQLPPNITQTSMRLECANGSSQVVFNDTRFLIPTLSTATEAAFTVSYASTDYVRYYILNEPVLYLNAYLVDATAYTLYQIPIQMLDSKYWDSEIQIIKNAIGGEITITDGYFDADHVFNSYLIKDEKYIIRIITDDETREVGFLYALEAGTQQISIAEITLEPDVILIADKIYIAAEINATTGIMRIQYVDSTGGTEELRVRVYEGTNQTALFDTTYTNPATLNNLIITIPGLNASLRYTVRAQVTHDTFGNSPVDMSFGVGAFGALGYLGPAIGSWIYTAISLVMITFASLIITPRIRLAGIIMLAGLLGVFYYLQWFYPAVGTMALIIVFIAVTFVYEIKKRGVT